MWYIALYVAPTSNTGTKMGFEKVGVALQRSNAHALHSSNPEIRDFRPFLIIAHFKYLTFQVAREIIEDNRTEKRFQILSAESC